jgi:dCTP diphosphatase
LVTLQKADHFKTLVETMTSWEDMTLQDVRSEMKRFSAERDWDQFHTPRNLMLALVGEVGELAELFQWKTDTSAEPGLPGFSTSEVNNVKDELADVLLYLVRLADRCGVDLASAVKAKLLKNAAKYPVDKCKGVSDKYTAYQNKN